MSGNGWSLLSNVSQRLQDDKDVVLACVATDDRALGCASERLRDDKAVVLECVTKDGRALEFVSRRLQGHDIVVRAAIQNHGPSIAFARECASRSKQNALAAVRCDGNAFHCIIPSFRAHPDILFLMFSQPGRPDGQWDNRQLCRFAVCSTSEVTRQCEPFEGNDAQ